MKRLLFVGPLFLAVLAIFLLYRSGSNGILDKKIELGVFTTNGSQNGRASIKVTFLESESRISLINAALDINGSGIFEDGEWVIKNTPARPRQGWNNSFYFTPGLPLQGEKRVRLVLSDFPLTAQGWQNNSLPEGRQFVEAVLEPELHEAGSLLDLEGVTNPIESMKGAGVVYAQKLQSIVEEDIPDLDQNPGECGPTVAANALIALTKKFGGKDQKKLVKDSAGLIDDLKDSMNWTKENGVLPDDFVSGGNVWTRENNLPITGTKIGDQNGVTTLDDIREVLNSQNKNAALLRFTFGNPETGEPVGGHVVNLIGLRDRDGKIHIDILDPATPKEIDTYEVRGNAIMDYGPFEGLVVLGWGFVETWEAEL